MLREGSSCQTYNAALTGFRLNAKLTVAAHVGAFSSLPSKATAHVRAHQASKSAGGLLKLKQKMEIRNDEVFRRI